MKARIIADFLGDCPTGKDGLWFLVLGLAFDFIVDLKRAACPKP
jgi:hypothetical protein